MWHTLWKVCLIHISSSHVVCLVKFLRVPGLFPSADSMMWFLSAVLNPREALWIWLGPHFYSWFLTAHVWAVSPASSITFLTQHSALSLFILCLFPVTNKEMLLKYLFFNFRRVHSLLRLHLSPTKLSL